MSLSKEVLKYAKIIELQSKTKANVIKSGSFLSFFKGEGLDFREVREYVYGDDIRRIDWNVSARTGSPHIKTFNEDLNISNVVMVDISSSMDFGSGDLSKLEWAIEITSLLLLVASILKNTIYLLAYNKDVELFLPISDNTSHIIRAISKLKESCKKIQHIHEPQIGLDQACFYIEKAVQKRGLLFIISDFLNINNDLSLRRLRNRFKVQPICLYDSLEREAFSNSHSSVLIRDQEKSSFGLINMHTKPKHMFHMPSHGLSFCTNTLSIKKFVDSINQRMN